MLISSREKNQQPLEIGWSFRLFDTHHWFSRELHHLDQSERFPMTRVFKYPKGKVTKRERDATGILKGSAGSQRKKAFSASPTETNRVDAQSQSDAGTPRPLKKMRFLVQIKPRARLLGVVTQPRASQRHDALLLRRYRQDGERYAPGAATPTNSVEASWMR